MVSNHLTNFGNCCDPTNYICEGSDLFYDSIKFGIKNINGMKLTNWPIDQ